MKVTVCELRNDSEKFKEDWDQLVTHCQVNKSELVLLSEMPFHPWIANRASVDDSLKDAAVQAHEEWLQRIDELGNVIVAYSKPWIQGDKFFNTAYIWTKETGHLKAHTKYFFPEEEVFYEDTWFDREAKHFELLEVRGLKLGFLLCTELWFTEYARKYGLEGIDLLLCPRATGASSVAQWTRAGQTLSVISGGYCLSSNRAGLGEGDFKWGGAGWITQPMDGALLGTTSAESPFLTIELDLARAKLAKQEYPLYVND